MIVVLIFIGLIFFAPCVMGLWVQHSYGNLIAFYNSQGNFHIEVKKYQRGWFSSDTTLVIEAPESVLYSLPRIVQEKNTGTTTGFHFSLNQHIQHGPFIYPKFEVAAIHSSVNLPEGVAAIIKPLNNKEPILQWDNDFAFDGSYHITFWSNGFENANSTDENKIKLNKFTGNLWIWLNPGRIQGDIKADAISMANQDLSLSVPGATLSFDRQRAANDLWTGSSKLSFPEVTVHDVNESNFSVTGFSMQSSTEDVSGVFGGMRNIDIDKIQINSENAGPLHFQISAKGLNTKAVEQLLAAYRQVSAENYQKQAVQQLVFLLPPIIASGSSIDVDHFQIKTAAGDLLLNAKIVWPEVNTTSPLTANDVIRAAYASGELRVTTTLADQLLHVVADMYNVEHVVPNTPHELVDEQKDIIRAKQQNELMLAMLTQENKLPKDAGKKLLILQNKDAAPADYFTELNLLLSENKISASVMHALHAQYDRVVLAGMPMDKRQEYKERQLETEFQRWIQQGYIAKDKNDYVISVTYQKGVVKANGHDFAQIDYSQ